MPAPPSLHAVFAIFLAVFAVVLFTREKLRLESSSLVVLLVILLWFEWFVIEQDGVRLRAQHVFRQFGNEALLTICALMVVSKSLERTGALQPLALVLGRLWAVRAGPAFLVTMVTAAALSMFMNNTPVVATVLPLLVAVSLRAGITPSGILMPVGFATIIGGMATTIGTSTNLLVTGIASDMGVAEFGMFDFAAPVFFTGAIAILYLWLVAPRILPERDPPMTTTAPRLFDASLDIATGGFAEGRNLSEVLAQVKGLRITRIQRGEVFLVRLPEVRIRAGDRLWATGTPDVLKEAESLLGAKLVFTDSDVEAAAGSGLPDEQLAEVVVTAGSVLDRGTLANTRLLSKYGLVPIALHRRGRPSRALKRLDDAVLEPGDILLVQGSPTGIERLHRSGQLPVADGRIHLPRVGRATVALLITAAVVVSAATGLLSILVAAGIGVLLLLLTRCLSWPDVIGALDRRIVMVVVASLALGLALTATGAAEYVALLFAESTRDYPVAYVLAGFMLLMALMTEVATNNAIAVLGTPIAVGIANQLGSPPEPFVLALLYGANMSYMIPVGYQTNLLVMAAGGYRFVDFLRVGLPLQLIMWAGLSVALIVVYDL